MSKSHSCCPRRTSFVVCDVCSILFVEYIVCARCFELSAIREVCAHEYPLPPPLPSLCVRLHGLGDIVGVV